MGCNVLCATKVEKLLSAVVGGVDMKWRKFKSALQQFCTAEQFHLPTKVYGVVFFAFFKWFYPLVIT